MWHEAVMNTELETQTHYFNYMIEFVFDELRSKFGRIKGKH